MKQCKMENQTEVRITAENLEMANLGEWKRLELHLLDQAAVVIPSRMTVMEVIHVSEALQGFASDLLSALVKACDHCDNCQMDEPCELMPGPVLPKESQYSKLCAGGGWTGPGLQVSLCGGARKRGDTSCRSRLSF